MTTTPEPVHLPPFLRTLIIDDRIARNSEYRNFFQSYFKVRASQAGIPKAQVEVCFEQYPERGIQRWEKELFDLTLIDLDFTQSDRIQKDARHFSYLAFNPEKQGLTVLRQLHDWVNQREGRFAYRKATAQFYLWTCVSKDKVQQHLKEYGFHEREETIYRLKKAPESEMRGVIEDISRRITTGSFTADQQLERLIQALRMNSVFTLQNTPRNACICRLDDASQWPCLANSPYAIVPVPELLQFSSDIRFLPLSGKIIAQPDDGGAALDDLVQYMSRNVVKKRLTYLQAICDDFKARHNGHSSQKNSGSAKTSDTSSKKPAVHRVLEQEFKNRFFAAATPLTGATTIGEEQAIARLKEKIADLLKGPFGGVVLKTAYLDRADQWDKVCWPGLHIQSHMRTRCLYPLADSPTLWNTGRTAMETLPPQVLNRFLSELQSDLPDTFRVIVSLGSKYHHVNKIPFSEFSAALDIETIWNTLFEQVFKDIPPECYPLVEINVRHFLREIVHSCLGGDEYLSPAKLTETGQADAARFYQEYREWLQVIHDVAVEHHKKLILKFPFRSDILSLIRTAVALRKWHKAQFGRVPERADWGIRGITLVNALKTPVPTAGSAQPRKHSAAWYASHGTWGDAHGKQWKYQMAGAQLATYRNQLLAGMVQPDILNELKQLDIALFFSGGIMTRADIDFIQQQVSPDGKVLTDYGIQIGSWALLAGNMPKESWDKADGAPKPRREWMLDVDTCKGGCCELPGHAICPDRNNIIKESRQKLRLKNPQNCADCNTQECLEHCDKKNLKLTPWVASAPAASALLSQGDKRIAPRICILNIRTCTACGTCMQTFYCDAFLDRRQIHIPPRHDPRNCTGCGLCAQLCPSGALRLYRPEELTILVCEQDNPRAVLQQKGTPHLYYHPQQDLGHIKLPGATGSMRDMEETQEILRILESKPTKAEAVRLAMRNWMDRIWADRLPERFILGYKRPEYDGDDRRKDCYARCVNMAEKQLADIPANSGLARLQAWIYAVLWSQLFWSDPGQIFWNTPVISLSNELLNEQQQPVQTTAYDLPPGTYQIRTYTVTGLKGDITAQIIDSPFFTFTGFPEWYQAHNLGQNNLGRLDLQHYGRWLMPPESYDAFSEEAICQLWGAPLE